MIRTAAATFAALGILTAATLGASHVVRSGAQAQAQAQIEQRSHSVSTEFVRWQSTGDRGFAAAGSRAEAVRTLEMLQELYAQEQRLWTYLDALEAQHSTRSQLARERAELEDRVARHEQQLQQLDASLEHLRPPAEPDPIRFTQPQTRSSTRKDHP